MQSLLISRKNKTIFITVVSLLISVLFISSHASALSGSDFNPGRIIDDAVFYNSNSMTSTQIQTFLDSKNPNCDVNGTQSAADWGYPDITHAQLAQYKREGSNGFKQDVGFNAPPYRCPTVYTQKNPQMEAASGYCDAITAGTRTAAQIIKDVSVACGINPQVLIVLLEKEQSLITDKWPLNRQLRNATGFACPDTAPCDPAYEGFFYQVYYAGKQFKIYQKNPTLYNYIAGRNNIILWNPNTSCGSSTVYIQNQATASLYIYTPYRPNQAALNNMYGTGDGCSAYGNRNFWRIFNDWFGSTISPATTTCDSKVSSVACVWSLRKQNGTQFLTSSSTELSDGMYKYGWINEGIVFYAYSSHKSGTVPVHRMRNGGLHYYSVDQTEYNSLKSNSAWVDEGVVYYVLPASISNASHQIYKLRYQSDTTNLYYWTLNSQQRDYLMNVGYTFERNAFNTPSGRVSLQDAGTGRDNIYRTRSGNARFYTTNITELDNVLKNGYAYEGVTTSANKSNVGTPVYRLYGHGEHFYTTSESERDNAVSKYGYKYEGIKFYLDDNSSLIYRLINPATGKHVFTSDINEVMSISNKGWRYERMLFVTSSNLVPVYRFSSIYNGEHFYTIDINEAASISNKGWRYERVAFLASPSNGTPVYRLYNGKDHFYTTDNTEKDNAVSKYGYTYEGIRFYVSETSTSNPVYRLQGHGEHFYTTDNTEKDNAVSKYGYTYEGEVFYLTP